MKNKVLFILLSITLLSGCIANRELRKKRKAIKKIESAKNLAPDLFKSDTVIVHDTVVIEKYKTDTITRLEYHDTTTVINNDRLILKYFYDTLRQEIYHEAECKGDTIVEKVEIPVTKYAGLSWIDKAQLNAIPLLLLFVGFVFLIRKQTA